MCQKDLKNKLALVDLDGTLIDTFLPNFYSYREALQEFGINVEEDYFRERCFGHSYKDFLPALSEEIDIGIVHERKTQLYSKNIHLAKPNAHLISILKAIRPDYYISLVTTASRENVEMVLDTFDLLDLFDYLVTQEDVKRNKPDPEAYNIAIDYFGVNRENCIVFEDSETGRLAAKNAGCKVFLYA